MTDKTDKALEEFLDGKSAVSRGYTELGAVQPPAALDRAILAAASDAVVRKEDATVVRLQRFRRWGVSAALAATVVLAVPLVVRVFDVRMSMPQPMLEEQVATKRADAPVDLELIAPSALTDAAPTVGTVARQSEAAPAMAAPQTTDPGRTAAPEPAQRPESESLVSYDLPATPVRDRETKEEISRYAYADKDAADSAPVLAETTENAVARLREQQVASAGQATRARRERFEPDSANTMAMKAPATPAPSSLANDTAPEEFVVVTGARPDYLDPRGFVQRIMGLYRSDQKRAARREFGEFLTMYPEAELPDNFPLERSEAIYPQRRIIQEADDRLRAIAGLAREGRMDAARQELANFFEIFPDYELPNWFPLTRADAAPIER